MPLTGSLDQIGENRLLGAWARTLRRHPAQANRMHEADAELLLLPGEATGRLLALTTDTLAEEIALGFYTDPETVGWMAATMSLSDLAAVAAEPLGLLAAVTLPRGAGPDYQERLAAGLDGACKAVGTWVLGGDTNFGAEASVTTTAVGLVDAAHVLRRTGCLSGEVVYASGPLGAGATVAAHALTGDAGSGGPPFRPVARVAEARRLVGFATACMDTSDGLIATLDQLSRLNGVGFEITAPLARLLEPGALRTCQALGLDPLVALAQPHGEFELVWTVCASESERFERESRLAGFEPLVVGRTIAEPLIRLCGEPARTIDAARIRNLTDEVGSDPRTYVPALVAALR